MPKAMATATLCSMLRPYWIKTNKPLSLGYGVTGKSKEDAEALVRLAMSNDAAIVAVETIENAASLDQAHVVPNMGNMLRRGIWYPLGFEHLMD